jgi:hypothetical protein
MIKLRRYGTVVWNSVGITSNRGKMGCSCDLLKDVADGKTKTFSTLLHMTCRQKTKLE